VESLLTHKDHAEMYTPMHRLAFSGYSNYLALKELDRLSESTRQAEVDSCSMLTPRIVLIIGESYNRHHSQQYGYDMPTTPRQIKREKSGLLTPFSDVVTPWNLTSFVFKNVFSMHVVGQQGSWADYPLFTQLFRKAGYHVTFLTNQFLPRARDAVYDFSGGFFLNDPELSAEQFDTRNAKLHAFDGQLLADYRELKAEDTGHDLTIFHLVGQHVNYRSRCPKNRRKFGADDYLHTRPHLNHKERSVLACYDNACLYNDSVVDAIMRTFSGEEAVVVYMPDHGEECYEGMKHFFCRNHTAAVDSTLAHDEFEIPFWIYCTRKFATRHPDVVRRIVAAKDKPYMIDALPHTLLSLAGISCKYYREEYDLLSPRYDERRPRLLKGSFDYDKIRNGHAR